MSRPYTIYDLLNISVEDLSQQKHMCNFLDDLESLFSISGPQPCQSTEDGSSIVLHFQHHDNCFNPTIEKHFQLLFSRSPIVLTLYSLQCVSGTHVAIKSLIELAKIFP